MDSDLIEYLQTHSAKMRHTSPSPEKSACQQAFELLLVGIKQTIRV